MPRYPKRGCATPGCPELTEGSHCEAHQREADARYRKFERDPAINKRYGHAWRKIRAAYVAEHPLCEDCEADGRLTPVQEVHHIRPLSHGGTHDASNLRSLCKPCHSRQSAKDGDRWDKRGKVYSY